MSSIIAIIALIVVGILCFNEVLDISIFGITFLVALAISIRNCINDYSRCCNHKKSSKAKETKK